MTLKGFDKDGRRKPVKVPDEFVEFYVDLVIPAVSQYSDLPFVRPDEVETDQLGHVHRRWRYAEDDHGRRFRRR